MDVWRDKGGHNKQCKDQRNSEGGEVSKKTQKARLR